MFKFLPNLLTLSRIPLSFLFVYYLLLPGVESKLWALAIFMIGAITDFLDGYLARKYRLFSNFGKLMDPITDKILTLSAFGVLAWMRLFPAWMFWIVAGREIGITVFRLWATSHGLVLAAETAGKWKTTLQMTVIIGILVGIVLQDAGYSNASSAHIFYKCVFIGMLAVVVLTLQSGLSVIAHSLAKLERKKIISRWPAGLTKFIATFAYVGLTPKLPGTAATLVMCVLMLFWNPSTGMHVTALALVILVGFIVCRLMEDQTGRKDPSMVVIDEVAGVLIGFLFLPVLNAQTAVMVFILFRYFDIRKVLGIRSLEAAGGSAGIMLDDILAGVYTNAVMQVLLLGWRTF